MASEQLAAVLEPPPGLTRVDALPGMNDSQLLARFSAGRDELAEFAFAVLVRRHGPLVLRVCRQILGDQHTAEDVFQATFLILARRAGSIRRPELLGNWLHGVALRTAREARMRDIRRREREAALAHHLVALLIDTMERPDLPLVSREEFEVLHEEVARLPERYRVPVVLCELEGLTYEEAARRLRCPVGTIGVRLRRARERLRDALTRRGLAPTVGLLCALLDADLDPANASPVLFDSTVSAAMGFVASHGTTSGPASVTVISLSEAVLKTMALARLKACLSIMLTVGVTMAVCWIALERQAKTPDVSARKPNEVIGAAPLPAVAANAAPEASEPVAESVSTVNSAALAPVVLAKVGLAPKAPQKVTTIPRPDLFADPARNATATGEKSPGQKENPPTGAPPLQPRPAPLDDERLGEMLFAKEWMPDDPISKGGDGLGPVYNDTSCVACHSLGAPGGAGPEGKNVVLMTANPGCGPANVIELISPGFVGSRTAVLHRHGTDPEYASWRRQFASPDKNQPSKSAADPVQARIRAINERTSPRSQMRERSRGSATINGVTVGFSERNTPALFGSSLIDKVPTEMLLALAANQPERVRGRVSRTRDGKVGRFGWKAQVPSLHEFVRAACANELGLEVAGHSQPASPLAPKEKAKGLARFSHRIIKHRMPFGT